MYLTRFPINRTRRETRRMLASPYRLHAAIAGSFPVDAAADVPAPGPGRVLWRLDEQGDGLVLFLASPTVPSLTGLDEQIGWPDLPQQWETRDYDAFLDRVAEGRRYTFRLVANPVVSRAGSRNGRGDSRRMGHLTPLQQAAWLIGAAAYEGTGVEPPALFADQTATRAERNGFSVEREAATGVPRLVVSHARKPPFDRGAGGSRITLATARFDGVLRVTDVRALRRALVEGIGHGKGFGCGMMTIAPLPE